MIITITALGEAITKANSTIARFNWKTKRSEVFIPEKFLAYEEEIRVAAKLVCKDTIPFPSGPVVFNCKYYLASKRKKDLPNLPKTTTDALNDVVYSDDSQIVQMTMEKLYDKENPRVEITIFRPENWEDLSTKDHWSLPDVHNSLKVKTKKVKEPKEPKTKNESTKTPRKAKSKSPRKKRASPAGPRVKSK